MRARSASSLTRQVEGGDPLPGVSASRPVSPSTMASRNGSVGLATVGVAHSAASSHLMALLASLNRLPGASGERLTSRSRSTPGSSSQGMNGRRTHPGPKRVEAGLSGRWPPSHSSTVGVAVEHARSTAGSTQNQSSSWVVVPLR